MAREVLRTVLSVAVAAWIALPVLYGVAVLTSSGSVASSSLPSPPPLNPLVTIEADVILFAPFNGTTVSVVATVSTNPSAPLVATLTAQYRPTGNGSTAVFSSYYGTFEAAVVNTTDPPHAVNVNVSVFYAGILGSGSTAVGAGEGTVVIPVVMGAVPPLPAENMTTTNGAADCPALGGAWNITGDTCTVDVSLVVTRLTIGSGVTFVNDGEEVDFISVSNYGTITDNLSPGSNLFSGTQGEPDFNYGTITVYGYGTIDIQKASDGGSSFGTSYNDNGIMSNLSGTLDNVGGTINIGLHGHLINHGGTINNTYGIVNNYGGTIENTGGGSIINLRGLIYNQFGGILINYGGFINASYGLIYNNGGLIFNSNGIIDNFGGHILNIGGTINNAYGDIRNSYGTIRNDYGTIYNIGGTLDNDRGTIYNHDGFIVGSPPIGGSVIG